MRILLLASVILLVGCSTAGPFVTSISSDGRGNLIVDKAHVEFNSFVGTISTKDATSSTINLGVK